MSSPRYVSFFDRGERLTIVLSSEVRACCITVGYTKFFVSPAFQVGYFVQCNIIYKTSLNSLTIC